MTVAVAKAKPVLRLLLERKGFVYLYALINICQLRRNISLQAIFCLFIVYFFSEL